LYINLYNKFILYKTPHTFSKEIPFHSAVAWEEKKNSFPSVFTVTLFLAGFVDEMLDDSKRRDGNHPRGTCENAFENLF